jgi:hypothetical protein
MKKRVRMKGQGTYKKKVIVERITCTNLILYHTVKHSNYKMLKTKKNSKFSLKVRGESVLNRI